MPEDKELRESGETEQQGEESLEQEEIGKKVSAKKYQKALADLEKAEADAAHWKNEYYKAYADTQNLRRSLEAEQRDILRYRAEGFIDGLLPALDAFHMALDAPAPTKEASNYQVGFTYIYNQIIQVLASEGLSEMSPKAGDKFDPAYMNAVDVAEDDSVEPGTVLKVHSKGYKLHDRLIKAAMVTVSKAKEEAKKEEPAEEEKSESPAQA